MPIVCVSYATFPHPHPKSRNLSEDCNPCQYVPSGRTINSLPSSCKTCWAPVLWGCCCRCKPHCQWYLRAGWAAVHAGHEQWQSSSAWRRLSRPAKNFVPLVTAAVAVIWTSSRSLQEQRDSTPKSSTWPVCQRNRSLIVGLARWALERCVSSGNFGPDRAGRLHGLPR